MSKEQTFIDFLYNNEESEDEVALESEEIQNSKKDTGDLPISGSPLYPRIYTGDSAKPLSTGPFPESEVGDDNITNTWRGLMSFYG